MKTKLSSLIVIVLFDEPVNHKLCPSADTNCCAGTD